MLYRSIQEYHWPRGKPRGVGLVPFPDHTIIMLEHPAPASCVTSVTFAVVMCKDELNVICLIDHPSHFMRFDRFWDGVSSETVVFELHCSNIQKNNRIKLLLFILSVISLTNGRLASLLCSAYPLLCVYSSAARWRTNTEYVELQSLGKNLSLNHAYPYT